MVRVRFLLVVAALFAAQFSQVSSASASAHEVVGLTETVELGNAVDPPPDSDGMAHGNGVDLVAGYTSAHVGGKSAGKQHGSGGGSVTPALPTVCANGDPMKPGIETIPCGNGTFLPLAQHNAPAVPCAGCSPDTIVRVSDLQNFPAYPAPTGMEPNGWAIVGLAANFWAGASAQIGEGLLLGEPAQVMFTPIGYRWDYGDGTTAVSADGGASWADLGLTEFSSTPTSHKYAARGSYSVTLTVDYRADYSFGDQGWRPVDGIVTVPSAPFAVVAATESTVLVAEDCNANPRGPGC